MNSSILFDLNVITLFVAVLSGLFIGREIGLVMWELHKLRKEKSMKFDLPIPKTARAKIKRITRRLTSTTVAAVVFASAVLGVSGIASPSKAGATGSSTDYTPFCTQGMYGDLGSWDWVTNGIHSISGFSSWNLADYSYIMVGTNEATLGGYQTYYLTTSIDTAHKIHMYLDSGYGSDEYYYMSGTDDHGYVFQVNTPNTNGDTSHESVTLLTGSWLHITQAAHNNFSTGHGAYSCYYAVHNVQYDASWTHYQYANTQAGIGVGTGSSSSGSSPATCQPLDVTCYINNVVSGVQNTFQSFFSNFLSALGALFTPDAGTIGADFDTLKTNLSAKLGFLTWPFTFAGSIVTAFGSPSTSSCTVGSGSFLGGSFAGINLCQWSTTAPSMWSLIKTIVIGTTIIGLFFALRAKFLEVTTR